MAVTNEPHRATERDAAPAGNGSLRARGNVGGATWGLCSLAGPVRAHNEDYAAVFAPDSAGIARGALFAVADGLGGHAAGEVASRTAVEALLQSWSLLEKDDPSKTLRACAREANAAVVAASYEKGHSGMGTTLTAMTLAGREAIIAHVGDSRAYLVRGDACMQLTNDHSRVGEMMRMKLISPERAATHPARSQLTCSLGAAFTLQVDLVRQATVAHDTFVLCSDGLWEQVAQSEIRQVVVDQDTATTWDAGAVADRLAALAVERGAADNVTAVVVRVLNDPVSQAGDVRRSMFRRRR